ncbi:MAG: RNA polymerase sigma factor [Polyangiaceae bacterium]
MEPDARSLETQLVARLRQGETGALGDAYELHHVHVRAFVRRFLGDEQVAEDLLQETFLALPRAIQRFRAESSLRTFLVALAINNARHHVRAAARRRAATRRLGASDAPAPSPEGPESEVARKQLAAALLRGLDGLSLEHRAVVVLCDVEERTSGEAAVIVGAPEATVRTRLFHARRALRTFLEAEGLR